MLPKSPFRSYGLNIPKGISEVLGDSDQLLDTILSLSSNSLRTVCPHLITLHSVCAYLC